MSIDTPFMQEQPKAIIILFGAVLSVQFSLSPLSPFVYFFLNINISIGSELVL